MPYAKIFDPRRQAPAAQPPAVSAAGDRRGGEVYVYEDEEENDEIVLAVNVALATGRPLLLYGPPGSGKSSLAPHVAKCLGWRYYSTVITSRTQARDLLYRFDAVRRLNDAEAKVVKEVAAYIEPGVLWWAFDRAGARRRGVAPGAKLDFEEAVESGEQPNQRHAVVLIDEIDKADPDVPNNLLVPLGSYYFNVPELNKEIRFEQTPLLIITTNDERELPKAFLRRCVVLTLKAPKKERLLKIAESHFGPKHRPLYEAIAGWVLSEDEGGSAAGKSAAPSTAEYIDAIRACLKLKITSTRVTPESDVWQKIFMAVLRKRAEP